MFIFGWFVYAVLIILIVAAFRTIRGNGKR
jgi:hypothetical protein